MKKLTRSGVRFKSLTMGLDLHKKFIEYCVLDRWGNEFASGGINSDREGMEKLLEKWKGQDLQVCIEACGCFVWVFDLLKEKRSCEVVHVAQSGRIRVIANSRRLAPAHGVFPMPRSSLVRV